MKNCLTTNFVDATLSDSVDCRYKHSMFIGYVNKLISKFGHLQPKVLLNLFIHIVVLFMDPLHVGYIRMVLIRV